MKVLQKEDLFLDSLNKPFYERGKWDAFWITHKNSHIDKSGVYCYGLDFEIEEEKTIKIHVSADNRYKFYFDGKLQGFGPERGDNENWFYETYELKLTKGSHRFFAITWYLTVDDNRPNAQFSYRPGFILCTEDLPKEKISTGFAPWKTISLDKYISLEKENEYLIFWYVGNRFRFHGKDFPVNFESGKVGDWQEPKNIIMGEQKQSRMPGDIYTRWWLRPSTLPIEYLAPAKNLKVRFAEEIDKYEPKRVTYSEKNSAKIQTLFDNILNKNTRAVIEPNKKIRAIVDFDNYYCVYPKTVTTGGEGSKIYIQFAESLYSVTPGINEKWGVECAIKENRDQIDNKYFDGYGDEIYPGGQEKETFEAPWWISGRYMELYIETGDKPLTIDEISFTECHYDFKWEGKFECKDSKFTNFIPIAKRALEMCSHETYMDCPYYEQIMYIGDTRVEALATYAWERDRYLQNKAIDMFHASIRDCGITQSRYPSFKTQFIPPFSLWYIATLYDYAMWNDNLAYIKNLLPDANSIIEFFLKHINDEGLMVSPQGWNFTDWTIGFTDGMTKEINQGISGQYNIHLIYTLDLLAKLEDILGEPELAARHRRISDNLYKTVEKVYWDEKAGMFADDKTHTIYLEHTQCLATLSDHAQDKINQMMEAIKVTDDKENKPFIYRTTIYYSFYLFEACKKAGCFETFDKNISFWSNLSKQGFKTTPECPEPARSDCHAWGAHPLYHLMTGILGINPSKPEFKEVKITPNLLSLEEVKGSVPHKLGNIEVDFKKSGNDLTGTIILPQGLTGTFKYNNKEIQLISGINKI